MAYSDIWRGGPGGPASNPPQAARVPGPSSQPGTRGAGRSAHGSSRRPGKLTVPLGRPARAHAAPLQAEGARAPPADIMLQNSPDKIRAAAVAVRAETGRRSRPRRCGKRDSCPRNRMARNGQCTRGRRRGGGGRDNGAARGEQAAVRTEHAALGQREQRAASLKVGEWTPPAQREAGRRHTSGANVLPAGIPARTDRSRPGRWVRCGCCSHGRVLRGWE